MHHRLLSLLIVLAFGLSGSLHAQISTRSVPYQGVLENAGVPVDDVVTMVFRFYATQTGGTALATVTLTDVEVVSGRFAVDIGPVSESVFDSPTLYLSVEVAGLALEGRTRIRGVPYAIRGEVVGDFSVDNLQVAGNSYVNDSLQVSNNVVVNDKLEVQGGTTLDDVTVGGDIAFGSTRRQMLNLWSTTFGVGVQDYTLYFRTADDVQWYRGGVHSDLRDAPGQGGTRLMTLKPSGNLDVSGLVISDSGIAPGASEALRIVRGTVASNGSVHQGAGFTISQPSTGVFDVTFSPAFSSPPTVVCTAMHPTNSASNIFGAAHCLVNHADQITASKARVIISDGSDSVQNWNFAFIAVGPR